MLLKLTILFFVFFSFSAISQNLTPQILPATEEITHEVESVWFEPANTPGFVGRHHKLELGFNLSPIINRQIANYMTGSNGLNPYNPNEIEISASFVSPAGISRVGFGFYYKPFIKDLRNDRMIEDTTTYNWRLRFSPDEDGLWNVKIKVNVSGKEIETISLTFVCVPSANKGYIAHNPEKEKGLNRYLNYSETGETFYSVGGNISHTSYDALTPLENEQHIKYLEELADNGGNFFRLELGPQNALPDWDNISDYTSKMDEMWLYDELIDYAHLRDLYFIMFRHHAEVSEIPWSGFDWTTNPYSKEYNLTEDPISYFTNEEALIHHKNTTQYIISRWGYSVNFTFFGFSEVDNWLTEAGIKSFKKEKDVYVFRDWFKELKNTIRNTSGNDKILLANTYAKTPSWEINANSNGIFSVSDVVGFHKYGMDKKINFTNRYKGSVDIFEGLGKPFLIEEIGVGGHSIQLYCCTDMSFHNSLWSSSFMGGIGTGMHWWWDRGIYLQNYPQQYKTVQLFFKGENMLSQEFIPQNWKDAGNIKNALIENYALKRADKERVLGWLHNASYYWPNLYETTPCIKELMDSSFLSKPCVYEDGIPSGIDLGSPNELMNPKIKDNFGKLVPIEATGKNSKKFILKKLKKNAMPFGKKHWYAVEFFQTKPENPTSLIQVPSSNQIIHTNKLGKLKPICPEMKGEIGDYCYKVQYLGKYRKKPNVIGLESITQSNLNLSNITESDVSPIGIVIEANDESGKYTVSSTEYIIESIIIYNTKGNQVFSDKAINLNSKIVEIDEKGLFLIQIKTTLGYIINRELTMLKPTTH